MKILVIGSSHVAALKAGWNRTAGADWPGVEVDFFAAHVLDFEQLEIGEDLVLHPPEHDVRRVRGSKDGLRHHLQRLNGRVLVPLAEYDHIIWAGFTKPAIDQVIYRPIQVLLGMSDVEDLRETGATRWMPRALFDVILRSYTRQFGVPKQWRMPGLPPLTLSLGPPISERLRAQPARFPLLNPLSRKPQGGREAVLLLVEALRLHLAGGNISLLSPPKETLAPSGLTKEEYNIGGINIVAADNPKDVFHMNAEYGKLCLDVFMAHVKSAQSLPA